MTTSAFNFNDLFILDLANNHQGDVEHGLRIIREMGQVVRELGVRAALKFQFRQLDTFIHPSQNASSSNKHIPRFLSTRLTRSDFDRLLKSVRDEGFISMATPFDEASVDQIVDLLETRIRPAVANDGGDIRFRSYKDGEVFLTMQGACAGCPSSTATLKHGIESLLKHYVPEVTAVHAV